MMARLSSAWEQSSADLGRSAWEVAVRVSWLLSLVLLPRKRDLLPFLSRATDSTGSHTAWKPLVMVEALAEFASCLVAAG